MASSGRSLAKPVAELVPVDRTSAQELPSLVLFEPAWPLPVGQGFKHVEGASPKDFSCGLFIEIQVPSSLAMLL